MSTAFSITGGNMQDSAVLNEIVTAYNERRGALHQAERYWTGSAWADGDYTVVANDKIQSAAFVSEIQQWIIDNCGDWMPPATTDYDDVDPDNFQRISVLAADAGQTDFEYFCKTIVGGNLVDGSNYGFRRSITKGSITGRGTMQTDDYFRWDSAGGYYDVWQDLRACLSALAITELPGGSGYDNSIQDLDATATNPEGYYRAVDQYAGTRTQANTDYDADDPGTQQAGPPYADHSQIDPAYGYFFHSQSGAVGYYIYTDMHDKISDIRLYFVATATSNYYGIWSDFGLGLHEDKLAYVASLAHASSGALESDILLEVENGADFGTDNEAGFEADATLGSPWFGIIIWNFTNSD